MKRIINNFKRINWGGRLNVFHYVNVFLVLIVFTLPFIAGSYSSEAKFEELSNYVSNRVMDSTTNGERMAISVTEEGNSGPIPSSDDEFLKTYGTFKQTNAVFCSGYNMNKNNSIHIKNIDKTSNLSIIYTGADISTEYNGHYKHGTYPFELMFKTPRIYDISRYMIYISQSQADAFLSMNSVEKKEDGYSLSDYETLIRQTFNMVVDGKNHTCVICNVYYEQNYYYNAIKEVIGDYVLCAYYNPTQLLRENIYFFDNKAYHTSYFMKYINENYPNRAYSVKMLKNNLTQQLDEKKITSFYYETFTTETVSFFYIILAFFLLSMVCILSFIKCWKFNIKYILLNCGVFFVPYLVFSIIYNVSKSVLFFSDFGIKMYVYLFIIYISLFIVIIVVNKLYESHIKRKKMICRN